MRLCPCGEEIPWRWSLCPDCLEQYGGDRKAWPKWLLFAVRDEQRTIDYARNHDEIRFVDEIDSDAYRTQYHDDDIGWGRYRDN